MVARDAGGGESPTILGHPIAHVGYSVESISDTVDLLVQSFGAGPFFLMEDLHIEEIKDAEGRPIVWDHSAAFGQWGGIAVELQEMSKVEPADALGPTYERVNLFNHVAYAVDDLPQERERLKELGFKLLFDAINGPVEEVLFDAPLLGHTIEVHQDFELFGEFHRELASAAEGWDGKEPLRPVPADVQEQVVNAGS